MKIEKLLSDKGKMIFDSVTENIGVENIEYCFGKYKTEGRFEYNGGKFHIILDSKSCSEYILTHELLHCLNISKRIIPSITLQEFNSSYQVDKIAVFLSDLLTHSWIIAEQKRYEINGITEHYEKNVDYILKMEYLEEGNAKDMELFIRLLQIKNDYLSIYEKNYEKLESKYPKTIVKVDEAYHLRREMILEQPFYAKRYVVKLFKYLMNWLKQIDGETKEFEANITFVPVFREEQLCNKADASLDIKINRLKGIFCFSTKSDNMKCSTYFVNEVINPNEVNVELKNNTLKKILNTFDLPYWIDDRKGNYDYIGN